jgi:hypothetical protein
MRGSPGLVASRASESGRDFFLSIKSVPQGETNNNAGTGRQLTANFSGANASTGFGAW